jgi:arabinose-5-phosphate isomerase
MIAGGTMRTAEEWLDLAREVFQIEIEGLEAVRGGLGQEFVSALALIASCTGRVVVTGVGKSGLVGRKIAATLSSTGTPAYFLHPVEGAHGDMGMIRREDIILAISNSGETDELNAIVPSLRSLGARIVSLCGNPGSTLARQSDLVLDCRIPREACPMGLAPTASTTAALAMGDALAVCLGRWNSFEAQDFKRFHPGGFLGQRLSRTISEFMHTVDLPVVEPGTPLQEALQVLNRGGLGTVVVVDHAGQLLGILTDGDVRRMVCGGRTDFSGPVEEAMVRDPKRALISQTAGEVMDVLEAGAITTLPIVTEERTLVGLVHLHDLLGKGKLKFGEPGLVP